MNVVIVGLGNIGKVYFKLLKKENKINQIYLIDEKEDKSKGIHNFNSFNDAKISNLNYAFICSPSHLHFKHAKYFLEKKIPVLIEKPFVLKIDDAKELIKISKDNKTKCYTAYQNRFNKSLQQLKKIYSSKKKLKDIFFIDMKLFWKRDKKYYKDGWHGKYKYDGGVMVNQSIHMLDALIYIFGEIEEFSVFSGFNKKKLEAEDLISIQFRLKNGIIANFAATTRSNFNYQVSIDVLSENSRVQVEGISMNKFFVYRNGNKKELKKFSEDFLYGHGIHHKTLVKNFLFDKLDHFLISKNLHALKTIHSIYNAISKKKSYSKIDDKQSILGK